MYVHVTQLGPEWTRKGGVKSPRKDTSLTFSDCPFDDFDGNHRRKRLTSGENMKAILSSEGLDKEEDEMMEKIEESPRRKRKEEYEKTLSLSEEELPSIGKKILLQSFERTKYPSTSVFYERNTRPDPWGTHGNVVGW
jgi:hypothetical protein